MKLFTLSLLAVLLFSTSLLSHSQAVFLQNQTATHSSGFFGWTPAAPEQKTGQNIVFASDIPGYSNAIDRVAPSVVSIFGYKAMRVSNRHRSASQNSADPLFGFLFPEFSMRQVQVDAGTGFLVSQDGYIVTSNHVVSDTAAHYTISLSDGTEKTADIVYQDPTNDIAILKINGSNYAALPLGDSSALKPGQPVLAMGNAFGQDTNVTSAGAITALHENIISSDKYADHPLSDLFETNMQLYPGDSGGPTFDASGSVVGINDAIAVDQDNVSFSVPINYAKKDLQLAIDLK